MAMPDQELAELDATPSFWARQRLRAQKLRGCLAKYAARASSELRKIPARLKKRVLQIRHLLKQQYRRAHRKFVFPVGDAIRVARKRTQQTLARTPKHLAAARRDLLLRWTMQAAALAPRWEGPPDSANVRQILVFGDMGIGNFIMFTPALRALRDRFPNAEHVVLFTKARGADLVTRGLTSVDRVVIIDAPKLLSIRSFLSMLRQVRDLKIKPDLIIGRWNGSPYVAMLTAALGARWRIGHISSAGYTGYCDSVFNGRVSMSLEAHEVERNLDLVRHAGATIAAPPPLEFPLTDADRDAARAIAAEAGLDFNRLICLQSGSSPLQHWKRWPIGHGRELVRLLTARGYQVAFLGSQEERSIPLEIVAGTAIEAEGERINLCGRMALHESGAFMQLARGVVCNDSGLMHVAAAVGAPLVAIFGPTEYDRTRPFTARCTLLREACACNAGTLFDRKTLKMIEDCPRPCLSRTTPQAVLDRVLELLNAAPAGGQTGSIHEH